MSTGGAVTILIGVNILGIINVIEYKTPHRKRIAYLGRNTSGTVYMPHAPAE